MKAEGPDPNQQQIQAAAAQQSQEAAQVEETSTSYLGSIYQSFGENISQLQGNMNDALEKWIDDENLLHIGTQATSAMLGQLKYMITEIQDGNATKSTQFPDYYFVSEMTSYMVALGIPESQIVIESNGTITMSDLKADLQLVNNQMQSIQQETQKDLLSVFALFTNIKSVEKIESSTMNTIYQMLARLSQAIAA